MHFLEAGDGITSPPIIEAYLLPHGEIWHIGLGFNGFGLLAEICAVFKRLSRSP